MDTPQTQRSNPAEIYDTKFVPALFAHWGPIVAEAAGVNSGDRVLDVACGTGAATLAAAKKVGTSGHVVGLDANPEMLEVARQKLTEIEWVEGMAEALPMPDKSFDAVISQFSMMFFEDKPAALSEMMRVLRPGGGLAAAVCGAVENSPGYGAFATLLDQLFGKEVGDAFRAPFVLGNFETLHALCREAGIANAKVETHHEAVHFSSIEAMILTERACVWTLGGILDDDQFARLKTQSEKELQAFVTADGSIRFDMPALIITTIKS